MALTLDVPIVSSTGRAFPEHRGLALGLVKSYVGLSGSLATLAYQAAFRPRVAPFVLAIALANVAFAAVYLAATARNADAPEPGRDAETRAAAARGLAVALGLTGFLAFSLVAAALAMHFSSAAAAGTGRVALGALVAAIFCCVLAFLRSRADPDPGAKASALEAPLLSEEPRASDAPDFAAGSLAEGAASYLMATLLFGSLYQRDQKPGLRRRRRGVGRGCFLNAALVAAALAAFATLLCVVLAVRSRARYAALYPQFFRNLNGAIQ
ncbi:hypothetical protein JL720_10536 [Aureococcus anophagefferens]|nr:hypothetical protein JL720_10536 [Aureococcus anophagefferens]